MQITFALMHLVLDIVSYTMNYFILWSDIVHGSECASSVQCIEYKAFSHLFWSILR